MNRRRFISAAGISAVASPLLGFGITATNLNKWKNSSFLPDTDICLFSKHLQFLDYKSLAEFGAEAGLDGFDLTVRGGGHVEPKRVEEDLPRIVEETKKAGLKIPMITTKITDADDPLTERIIKTASKLGIKYYRMGYYSYDDGLGIEGTLDKCRMQISELADLNRHYGMHGAYQNHSGTRVGGPVWDIFYMIKGQNPNYIGCQYDIRHAVAEGGYSWETGFKLTKDYVKTVCIKDFIWEKKSDGGWGIKNVPLGEGMINLDKFAGYLDDIEFKGPVSLHIEYPIFNKGSGMKEKRKSALNYVKKDVEALRNRIK